MIKPILQREVAVTFHLESTRYIVFCATNDAAASFVDFGKMVKQEAPSEYSLFVDPRYDFKEVLQYIETYG